MEKVTVGYIASVTESESGWGQRPDGYVIGWDRQLLDAWFKANGRVISGDAREYSIVDDTMLMVALTPHAQEIIQQHQQSLIDKPNLVTRPFVWVFGPRDKYVQLA